MQRVCPNCGHAVSSTAKFCPNCGFNLSAATNTAQPAPVQLSEPLAALRRAAPQNVATKILAEREHLEGERKLVTTLFPDIVGSTALAEQMDPEDWRDIVSGAHQRVSQAVYRYEGTIAQLLGDGVLSFFGAPLAHEDDAERAVRAALEIQASIQGYSEELRQKYGLADFQVRAGLNTGLVVVGNIGSDLHMEYLAVGDTVNLAARMQSAAEPDTILISANTQRLLGALFELEDRGMITVKGKAEPIQVYRVVGEHKGAVRTRGITGLASPLVGRQREFTTLLQIIDRLQAGQGALVSIIGEAGLGKSRLVAEWRKSTLAKMGEGGVRWVEGRCLSYGVSMAYHLSTDILRALVGAGPDAGETEVYRLLAEVTGQVLGSEAGEVFPFLGHLLGLQLEAEAAARVRYMDGPALQAQYVEAYRRLLQALAARRPLVIVCEDVHWADASSVDLGMQLLPTVTAAPIVMVFVARRETDALGWKLIARAREVPGAGSTELNLAPLSDAESRQLVSNLLEIEALPESLRQLILAKAEGNPFFVEEVIRMLIDRGGIARQGPAARWTVTREIQNIEIPDTLQGVLTARIDRLPEDVKRTLQIAAVIGRKFQVRVLEEVLQQGL
jgi:class 3 adenylate cyclase